MLTDQQSRARTSGRFRRRWSSITKGTAFHITTFVTPARRWPFALKPKAGCRVDLVSSCAKFLAGILSHMEQYQEPLGGIFQALADPTRRAVLGRLGKGAQLVERRAREGVYQ